MLDVERNLKIPQANLHAALNFVHAKSFSHCITNILWVGY